MKMNYFVVGTSDMEASVKFYDALFKETGINRVLAGERMTFWQCEEEDFTFAVAIPFDGEEASNGNGTMVGFEVGSSEEVKKLHKRAIDLGGANEGDPNQRGPKFSAYVRDLDKNKIAFASDIA